MTLFPFRRAVCVTALAFIAPAFLSIAHAAPAIPAQDALVAARATFKEWVEVLRLPNDSLVPADIQRNAAWFEEAFKKRGFVARQLANDGKPMVYAEAPNAAPGKTTVLFYAHLDGQAVTASEWQQESPWTPVLKQRVNGKWEAMPLEALYGAKVDPEWRLFARSSSDDKAPIMMLLAAIDALKAKGIEPAVNIKVLLDSEEEKSSPSLGRVIETNAAMLKADALVVLDGPMHQSNQPTLVFGNRGVVRVALKVFGPKQELHSGHYGNYAANPAQGLARLLASMKDDNGRVTIPGYYDAVKLDDDTQKVLQAVPDDEPALRKRLGIAEAEKVGRNYQESMQYPSLNVRGMQAADIGGKARTIVPETATAEIDLRTVPEASPEALFTLLKDHVEKQGYHLVKGAPTDEERAKYSKMASLELGGLSASGMAVRTELASPIGDWLRRSFRTTYGKEPVQIRMMGGTVPTGTAVSALKVPFAIVPLVNADNNQHSFNENMRLGNYIDGVRGLTGLLTQPFDGR
jgi:acetylornithine deacetylase/succinyl-diaminopimelate desuccinylase-like protein